MKKTVTQVEVNFFSREGEVERFIHSLAQSVTGNEN